jgi:hypothetical protein
MKNNKIFQFPITPVLAALLPLSFLASHNISQINFADLSRSLYILPISGLILLLLCYLLFRNWSKAAIAGSLLILIFTSYGQIYHALEQGHSLFGHHKVLLPVFGIILLLVIIGIIRTHHDLRHLIGYFNLIFLVLILYSAIPVSFVMINNEINNKKHKDELLEFDKNLPLNEQKPDVYFIVLDMYARQDVLKEKFNFDNKKFYDSLEKLGFVEQKCSQSNYSSTLFSLGSTLSMEYITDTSDTTTNDSFSLLASPDAELILHGKVRKIFENHGYKTVAYETAFAFTEMSDANYFFHANYSPKVLNDFESLLVNSTMLSAYTDYSKLHVVARNNVDMNEFDESPEYHYSVNMGALDNLEQVTSIQGPKFVFSHITLTHEPFVVTENGEYSTENVGEDGYLAAIKYVNKRVLQLFSKIITDSPTEPIIILESDHGYGHEFPETRMDNLMAFKLPASIQKDLYPTMTPVNSFRLLFNSLFNQNIPLLPDYSFYSPSLENYNFHLVQNSCNQ